MKRSLLAPLLSVYVCPYQGWGRSWGLFAHEGMSQFNHGGCGNEDFLTTIAEWLNPEQWINSGRCRAT